VKILSLSIVCIFFISSLGCDSLWNSANKGGLESHLVQVTANYGITSMKLDCKMIGSTRDAMCTAKVPDDKAKFFLAQAPLGPPVNLRTVMRSVKCPMRDGRQLWVSKRRPSWLKLKGGMSFEYMYVSYYPQTSELCFDLSYTSG